jgi:oxidase EvaA
MILRNRIREVLEEELPGGLDEYIEARLDHFVECLISESAFHDQARVLDWFQQYKARLPVSVERIPLKDVGGGWSTNANTGDLEHTTGGFFRVIGVRTETDQRESGKGWNQPMVDQGTESSVAGLLRKRFDGNFYYLVEAKFEPGNFGKVLFSPTLQVTFDNLNQIHGGRRPRFAEYFDGSSDANRTIFCHWCPEDGGRFYLKRVMNMLVETDDEVQLPDGFVWLNMYQIKNLIRSDDLVNPHLRSIISFM